MFPLAGWMKQNRRSKNIITRSTIDHNYKGREPRHRGRFEQLEDRRMLSAGDPLWAQQFGSEGFANDAANAVDVDVDGNVYVAGTVRGTLPGQTSNNGDSAFVSKYDTTGN